MGAGNRAVGVVLMTIAWVLFVPVFLLTILFTFLLMLACGCAHGADSWLGYVHSIGFELTMIGLGWIVFFALMAAATKVAEE